jgi:hypothetical protein
VLASAALVGAALEKNKSYMGRRYVEVFRAKKLVRGRSAARVRLFGLLLNTAAAAAAGV